MSHDPAWRRLEEEFRALRLINPVIETAATRRLRFLHASIAAAEVSHAGSPNFLVSDGSHDRLLECFWIPDNRHTGGDRVLKESSQIVAGGKHVRRRDRVQRAFL